LVPKINGEVAAVVARGAAPTCVLPVGVAVATGAVAEVVCAVLVGGISGVMPGEGVIESNG
jgi:hypothetical protein